MRAVKQTSLQEVRQKEEEARAGELLALDVAASVYEASLVTEAQALTALDVAASLYEEVLTIKMQLEGGNA